MAKVTIEIDEDVRLEMICALTERHARIDRLTRTYPDSAHFADCLRWTCEALEILTAAIPK